MRKLSQVNIVSTESSAVKMQSNDSLNKLVHHKSHFDSTRKDSGTILNSISSFPIHNFKHYEELPTLLQTEASDLNSAKELNDQLSAFSLAEESLNKLVQSLRDAMVRSLIPDSRDTSVELLVAELEKTKIDNASIRGELEKAESEVVLKRQGIMVLQQRMANMKKQLLDWSEEEVSESVARRLNILLGVSKPTSAQGEFEAEGFSSVGSVRMDGWDRSGHHSSKGSTGIQGRKDKFLQLAQKLKRKCQGLLERFDDQDTKEFIAKIDVPSSRLVKQSTAEEKSLQQGHARTEADNGDDGIATPAYLPRRALNLANILDPEEIAAHGEGFKTVDPTPAISRKES